MCESSKTVLRCPVGETEQFKVDLGLYKMVVRAANLCGSKEKTRGRSGGSADGHEDGRNQE